MALESKPLFHPEVLRQQVRGFAVPDRVTAALPRLNHWAERLTRALADADAEPSDRADRLFQLTPDEIRLQPKEVEH